MKDQAMPDWEVKEMTAQAFINLMARMPKLNLRRRNTL
jgi:hypothetical protein